MSSLRWRTPRRLASGSSHLDREGAPMKEARPQGAFSPGAGLNRARPVPARKRRRSTVDRATANKPIGRPRKKSKKGRPQAAAEFVPDITKPRTHELMRVEQARQAAAKSRSFTPPLKTLTKPSRLKPGLVAKLHDQENRSRGLRREREAAKPRAAKPRPTIAQVGTSGSSTPKMRSEGGRFTSAAWASAAFEPLFTHLTGTL